MRRLREVSTALIGAVVAVFCMQAATADEDLPPVHQQGAVRYITGGIGIDEAKALRAEARSFPLALTFALRSGDRDEFTSAVQVTITKKGASVFDATSDGPYMLVDLPAGAYRVAAVSAGRKKERTVLLKPGQHAALVFVWPAED